MFCLSKQCPLPWPTPALSNIEGQLRVPFLLSLRVLLQGQISDAVPGSLLGHLQASRSILEQVFSPIPSTQVRKLKLTSETFLSTGAQCTDGRAQSKSASCNSDPSFLQNPEVQGMDGTLPLDCR